MGANRWNNPNRLPILDAAADIHLNVTQEISDTAEPNNPFECALSKAASAAGWVAYIMNETALIEMPADRDVIRHNLQRDNSHAEGVRPGDMVMYRYRVAKVARGQRRALDDNGVFTPGHYKLTAPSMGFHVRRDKQSKTRHQRTDARRDGEQPAYRRHARLERAAAVHRRFRGEVAA